MRVLVGGDGGSPSGRLDHEKIREAIENLHVILVVRGDGGSPSGRLPVSIPRADSPVPAPLDMSMRAPPGSPRPWRVV